MATAAAKAPKTVPIIINGEQFKIDPPVLGSELRELGRIPPDNQLFEERPGPEPDVLIDPGASCDPKPGTHYYDLPRGTVGDDARAEQLSYATERLADARHDVLADGSDVMRWRARLAGGWTPPEVSLLVAVPPAYPQQAPSGFDVLGTISNESGLSGAGANTVAGEATTHFCWNPAGTIDYAAVDGLWRFAKFAEQRFRQ